MTALLSLHKSTSDNKSQYYKWQIHAMHESQFEQDV